MNRNFLILLVMLLVLGTGRAEAAGTNAASAKPAPVKANAKMDFQSFNLITERNIFNKSRSGRVLRRGAPVKQVQVDNFALLGTMSYEGGQFAFFEGSSAEYQKTLKLKDTIGGYQIMAIGPDYIQLAATNNQAVKMPVGMEMKRRDRGPWSLGAQVETTVASNNSSNSNRNGSSRNRGSGRSRSSSSNQRSDSDSSDDSSSNSGTSSTSGTSSGSSNDDDIVKRLMEKRAKEGNEN